MDERQGQLACPLLPPRYRRLAAIVLGCCVALVAILAVISAHQTHGNAVDQPIDSYIFRHLARYRWTMRQITQLGEAPEVTALTVILIIASLALRRVNVAVLAAVSVPAASALTEFGLKPLVDQKIYQYLSYPSGHLTVLFALIGSVAILLLSPPGQRLRPAVRVLIVLVLVVVAAIVAVALIQLRDHYFTDTVAGAAVGIGVVLTASFLLDIPAVRRRLEFGSASRRIAPESDPIDEGARRS